MQFTEISLLYTTYTHTQWGGTAVCYASDKGHSEVVKLLVQAGVDLELQITVIIYSCHGNNMSRYNVWQHNALLHYIYNHCIIIHCMTNNSLLSWVQLICTCVGLTPQFPFCSVTHDPFSILLSLSCVGESGHSTDYIIRQRSQ